MYLNPSAIVFAVFVLFLTLGGGYLCQVLNRILHNQEGFQRSLEEYRSELKEFRDMYEHDRAYSQWTIHALMANMSGSCGKITTKIFEDDSPKDACTGCIVSDDARNSTMIVTAAHCVSLTMLVAFELHSERIELDASAFQVGFNDVAVYFLNATDKFPPLHFGSLPPPASQALLYSSFISPHIFPIVLSRESVAMEYSYPYFLPEGSYVASGLSTEGLSGSVALGVHGIAGINLGGVLGSKTTVRLLGLESIRFLSSCR